MNTVENSWIYIFFPDYYHHDQLAALTRIQLAQFYNTCVRQAVCDSMPECAADWPVSYVAAITDRKNSRHLLSHGVEVAGINVDPFIARLRARLHDSGLDGCFFVTEVLGLKNMKAYRPSDADNTVQIFEEATPFLNHADGSRVLPAEWSVDIRLEVSRTDGPFVLVWKADAHRRLLELGLPHATESQLDRLMRSDRLVADINGHVYPLQGFRGSPGVAGENDGVVYMNVYSAEKAATYSFRHQGHFRHHSPHDLYPTNVSNLLLDAKMLMRVYRWCYGDGSNQPGIHRVDNTASAVQTGNARYEVRVRLDYAHRALSNVPDALMDRIICLRATTWW